MRTAIKKIIQGKGDPEAIASMMERVVPMDKAHEEAIEEIAQLFLTFRTVLRQSNILPQPALYQFIRTSESFARKKGINLERLYSRLLERILLESDQDEVSRVIPKQSTKEKILDAALDVFSEKGFHLATVDEIAECAGVGKGTLYRYFANKETLFHELVRLRLEELERNANAALDGQDDVLTMITKYLRTYFEFFDRNQRLYRLIVQERLDVGEQVQDLYVKKIMRRIPLLKRKIHEASQQGELKDIDFQTVFYGVMGFVHGVIQKWLASECAYPLVDELPTVTEALFYGFVKTDDHVKKG